MSDYNNNKKRDGKVTKIHIVLQRALLVMLNHRSFAKISVNDLCEEAMISRSTFYVYFDDKFDLLEYCMVNLKIHFDEFAAKHTEHQIIDKITDYLFDNSQLVKNLLGENNAEVMVLLIDLLTPSLSAHLSPEERRNQQMSMPHMILANFCAGGIAYLLMWQVRNNFPFEKELISQYLYRMLKGIMMLDLESSPQ